MANQRLKAEGLTGKVLSSVDDETLGQLVAIGHDAAYTEIVRRYQAGLKTYANTVLEDDVLAKEVVSSALFELARRLRSGILEDSPSHMLLEHVHLSLLDNLDRQAASDPHAQASTVFGQAATLGGIIAATRRSNKPSRAKTLASHLAQRTPESCLADLDIAYGVPRNKVLAATPFSLIVWMLDRQNSATPKTGNGNVFSKIDASTWRLIGLTVLTVLFFVFLFSRGGDDESPAPTPTPTVQTPAPQPPTTTPNSNDLLPSAEEEAAEKEAAEKEAAAAAKKRAEERRIQAAEDRRRKKAAEEKSRKTVSASVVSASVKDGTITIRTSDDVLDLKASDARIRSAKNCERARVVYFTRVASNDKKSLVVQSFACTRQKPDVLKATGTVTDWDNLNVTIKMDGTGKNEKFKLDETMLDAVDGCQKASFSWEESSSARPLLKTFKCTKQAPSPSASDSEKKKKDPKETEPQNTSKDKNKEDVGNASNGGGTEIDEQEPVEETN